MAARKRVDPLNWDGLDKYVPSEYREQVLKYLEEADTRVIALAVESTEIKLNRKTLNHAKKRGRKGNATKKQRSEFRLIAECRKVVILIMLSHGIPHNEIAAELGITETYLVNIMDRLRKDHNCRTRTQLVALAIRSGYIE